MSIATLKRKTMRGGNPRLDPVSGIGANGFSLSGGYRNIGAVGQFRMVSNVTRTPFRGTQPMGNGGSGGTYYDVPCNSGSCCTNDDAIIKHSSLTTAGMLDEKYKWTKSQYPRYWVKDDDNANRITKTQGQLTGAKTWAAGACNFEKAANYDPNNVWQCNGKCVYWIGGKKKLLYYPYAKWLNTTKVQSQGIYIKAGGVARNNCLPTPACIQPYPMMLTANGCDSNAVTWQQAQAQGLLPPDYLNCDKSKLPSKPNHNPNHNLNGDNFLSSPNPLSLIANQNAPGGNIWTLKNSYTVVGGSILTIPSGSTLIIPSNYRLTTNPDGIIENDGTLIVNVNGNISIASQSSMTNTGTIYNNGGSINLLTGVYSPGILNNNGKICNYNGGTISSNVTGNPVQTGCPPSYP